jgi:hypothetical protein
VVPKQRVEVRPFFYGTASLALHLGVLVAALWFGSEMLTPSVAGEGKTRRARISSRFAAPAQTTKRAPKPEPLEAPITTDTTPAPVPSAAKEEDGGAEQQTFVPEPVEPGGDLVIDPPDTKAGRERRFDPDANAEFDTVKVGAYSTVSTGKLSGDHYGAEAKRTGLIVVSCDATSCLVLGGDEAVPIRKAVEQHLAEITACYANQSGTGGRKIEIDVGLDTAGKVDNLQVGGVGDVGDCVANIIKRTTFGLDAGVVARRSA